MKELKPCPFCGGEAKLTTDVTNGVPHFPKAYIICKECKSRTAIHIDTDYNGTFIDDTIDTWNKRFYE